MEFSSWISPCQRARAAGKFITENRFHRGRISGISVAGCKYEWEFFPPGSKWKSVPVSVGVIFCWQEVVTTSVTVIWMERFGAKTGRRRWKFPPDTKCCLVGGKQPESNQQQQQQCECPERKRENCHHARKMATTYGDPGQVIASIVNFLCFLVINFLQVSLRHFTFFSK